VNDVVVTKTSAWFTDSFRAVLYRVPIVHKQLGDPSTVEVLPLTGDFALAEGFNANGIELTPDRERLVIVQSNTGRLFSVDPETGVTDEIESRAATRRSATVSCWSARPCTSCRTS
jgi:sugar lactone lactonase YvrE